MREDERGEAVTLMFCDDCGKPLPHQEARIAPNGFCEWSGVGEPPPHLYRNFVPESSLNAALARAEETERERDAQDRLRFENWQRYQAAESIIEQAQAFAQKWQPEDWANELARLLNPKESENG